MGWRSVLHTGTKFHVRRMNLNRKCDGSKSKAVASCACAAHSLFPHQGDRPGEELGHAGAQWPGEKPLKRLHGSRLLQEPTETPCQPKYSVPLPKIPCLEGAGFPVDRMPTIEPAQSCALPQSSHNPPAEKAQVCRVSGFNKKKLGTKKTPPRNRLNARSPLPSMRYRYRPAKVAFQFQPGHSSHSVVSLK